MTQQLEKITQIAVGLAFPSDPKAERFEMWPNDRFLVAQAIDFAKRVGARLRFVSVVEGEDHSLATTEGTYFEAMRAKLQVELDAVVAQAAEAGVEAESKVDFGYAWQRLILDARGHEAQLLMVSPRRGRRPTFDALLHGSTTRRLLRKAPMPVWVVNPQPGPGYRRILVPVDLSETSAEAIEIARDLAAQNDAELYLLHGVRFPADITLHRFHDGDERVAAYHSGVKAAARQQIDALLGEDAGRWTVYVSGREVCESVKEVVAHDDIDLIVMASVGRDALPGLLVGNTAEKLFNTQDSSLWVFKPEGFQSPV